MLCVIYCCAGLTWTMMSVTVTPQFTFTLFVLGWKDSEADTMLMIRTQARFLDKSAQEWPEGRGEG